MADPQLSKTRKMVLDAIDTNLSRATTTDKKVGYRLLRLAVQHTIEYTHLVHVYSDVTSKPEFRGHSFRDFVQVSFSVHRIFADYASHWESLTSLVRHLQIFDLSESESRAISTFWATSHTFLTVILSPDPQNGIKRRDWRGNAGVEMDELRLNVMYELLAACITGRARGNDVPETLRSAITALKLQMVHSLASKARFRPCARSVPDVI